MARHRSPQGRRAHLGPPLSAALATAGVGGATRTVAFPQADRSSSGPSSGSLASLTSSMPARFIATAVAGTVVAATGQHLLVEAVPMAADGAAALRAGVNGLLGTPAPAAPTTPDVPAATPIAAASASASLVAEPIGTVAPVGADPVIADAAGLVKAADLQRVAAEQAAAEQARLAEQAAQERERAAAEEEQAVDEDSAAAAAAAASGGVATLLVDGTFTSGFGFRDGAPHEGIDIAAPIGTPIHVPLDGTVIDSGPAAGFGLWVRVQHEDGTITTYGHVNRSLVSVGEEVTAGEVIAEVGNRGQSTGPHLHFEVTTAAGQKINPRPWLAELGIDL